MKKLTIALMCFAALALTACGGKSGGSASSSESSDNSSGLVDGKWPAAVYDKYGIPEIETKGHIVCTELSGEEASYLYKVYYNGVTAEEMQAYVKTLKDKGFRVPWYTQERIDNGRSDFDATLYLPAEKSDRTLKIQFDFEHPMSFEYYADEPNPAFEVVERDGESYIDYNFTVYLCTIKNQPEAEGSIEALGLTAADLNGIPNVRTVNMQGSATGGSIGVNLYGDHQLAEGDMDAIHDKLADVLEAKGVKCYHTFSGKEMTAEQLKADKVRSYVVEKDGKKFMLMAMTDDRIGDFGCHIDYRFMVSNK